MKKKLINSLVNLSNIYSNIPLTPVIDKKPFITDWNKKPFTPKKLIEKLGDCQAETNGVGLITGYPFEHKGKNITLIAIDQDGNSAREKFKELFGEYLTKLKPYSVSYTSGKDKRGQVLYYVTEPIASMIRTHKELCLDENGTNEYLEFRFTGCQSVLPPSAHPETVGYNFLSGRSFDELEIAPLPDVISNFLIEKTRSKNNNKTIAEDVTGVKLEPLETEVNIKDLQKVFYYLNTLKPYRWDTYDDWIKIGMILKGIDPSLLWVWDKLSKKSAKYCSNECQRKWLSFPENPDVGIGTLKFMAIEDGCLEQEPLSNNYDVNKTFYQIAFNELFNDRKWICIYGEMYYWNSNYYKKSHDDIEKKRISQFCDNYVVKGETKYAKPSEVENILKWAKVQSSVNPELINPAGLNCTNGVLEITWNDKKIKCQLVQYDPDKHYYTYEPQVKYDPDADPSNCNQLLECLDTLQREVFVRTIAASLDLATVRKHKGRLVKALFLMGGGENGKDALREGTELLYGKTGITSCTFSDFQNYDSGRKFPIAKLAHARINWSSENSGIAQVDKLQSLKAAITGDQIDIEKKGKDEYSIKPNCVFLFNINVAPELKAELEAIKSRYAILTFNKIFKENPDLSKGELQANPRFKYDSDFVKNEVLPSFLNILLNALQRLMEEGINYSCTESALEDVRKLSSHLYSFSKDVGLDYVPNTKTYAGDIWKSLQKWYIDNGTLIIKPDVSGENQTIWSGQVKDSDKNVKAPNQVIPRFQEIFPNTKKGSDKYGVYLMGLGFNTQSIKKSEAVVEQLVELYPPLNGNSESIEQVLPTFKKRNIPVLHTESNSKQTSIAKIYYDPNSPNYDEMLEVDKNALTASNKDTAGTTASPIASPLLHQEDDQAVEREEENPFYFEDETGTYYSVFLDVEQSDFNINPEQNKQNTNVKECIMAIRQALHLFGDDQCLTKLKKISTDYPDKEVKREAKHLLTLDEKQKFDTIWANRT